MVRKKKITSTSCAYLTTKPKGKEVGAGGPEERKVLLRLGYVTICRA